MVGDATWGPQEESDAVAAIQTAVECGVTFFDTAEGYGGGYSEQLLAKEWRDELVHQAGLRRNGFAQLTRSRSGVGRRYASPSTPLKL